MNRTLIALAAAAIVCAATQPVHAQGQVYDPLPPPGSAYVRFVNSTGARLDIRPDFLPAQTLGTNPADQITPYAVVQQVAGRDLRLDLHAGARSGQANLHAAEGTYVTVLLEASPGHDITAVPVVDKTDFNQTRARLSFYNATSACPSATLTLAEGGTEVFAAVDPGTAKARSVNPVTAEVIASCAGGKAPPFTLHGIEAGGMYSIWLMQADADVTAFLTRDATARWKP